MAVCRLISGIVLILRISTLSSLSTMYFSTFYVMESYIYTYCVLRHRASG